MEKKKEGFDYEAIKKKTTIRRKRPLVPNSKSNLFILYFSV
jgi:hypothetical protein